jgi:opacity protein-like surface antigen
MRKLSLIFLTVGTVFLFLNSCLADDSTMVRKGKWGISLSASGLSNLGIGLYQGGIGVKHWFSDIFLVKTILGFSVDQTSEQNSSPDFTDLKANRSTYSLSLGPEFHFLHDSKFSPYFYSGFSTTYSPTTFDYPILKINPTPGVLRGKHRSTNSIGVDAGIGLEYAFTKHFSLSGEYLVGFRYEVNKEEWLYVPGPGVTEKLRMPSTTHTTFGARTSSLILTVYF